MRYDFRCESCEDIFEHSCRMAERPDVLPCLSCGGDARQTFTSVPEVFVRFRPYEFDRSKNVMSNGRKHGRTDQQQHEHYRKIVEMNRSAAARRRQNGGNKDAAELLAVFPGEMVDSVNENEGAKETLQKDPITFAKKLGVYLGSD